MAFDIPSPPIQSSDIMEATNVLLGGNNRDIAGFSAQQGPGVSGLGTRQSRVQNGRPAVSTRQMMHWLIPEGPIVQMYINPQSVRYSYEKLITPQRTKGGYVIQYWGEDLTKLNLSGTTGTSGIEGINILYDIYRNEQLAYDPFALLQVAAQNEQSIEANIVGGVFGATGLGSGGGGGFVEGLLGASQNGAGAQAQSPSLASMAFRVELFYGGEVFRGYFQNFSVNESAEFIGMFNYDINFVVTQKRGFRQNFLGWHRSATNGYSSSSPVFGRPYSYSTLVEGEGTFPKLETVGSSLTSAFDLF